jgi:hypothetical protein
MNATAYKCFTSRLCSPVRGGDPAWDGTLPHALPKVVLEDSVVCVPLEEGTLPVRGRRPGWSACATAEGAIRHGGFWPDGRPSRLFRVETEAPVIMCGDKLRAATWTIVEEIDVSPVIEELSGRWFGADAQLMAREQRLWREALARPQRDVMAVEEGLRCALKARRLSWTLRRLDSISGVFGILDAKDPWDISTWDAEDLDAEDLADWDACDAWHGRYVWGYRNTPQVVAGFSSAWDVGVAWDASQARTETLLRGHARLDPCPVRPLHPRHP